jgi:uncharacterized protein
LTIIVSGIDKYHEVLHAGDVWIQRDISEALREEVATRPVVIVTGGRQTGKTDVLVNTFADMTYISLDLPLIAEEADQSGGGFLDQFMMPIILDEVQYAPTIFRYIKARVDMNRHKNGQYLLSGSQRFQLMSGVVESLAGRAGIVDLHSLSLSELHRWSGKKLTRDQILTWCLQGGYPELHSKQLSLDRFYGSLVVTYLERDVRTALQVRSLVEFHRFLRLLASRSGQLLSSNGMATELGVSHNTIRSWLDVLETSGIIHLVPPYFPRNFGKRIIKTPKVMFLDTGLLCFLLGIRTVKELLASSLLGSIFETLVYGQLVRWHSNRMLQTPIYFFRDHSGREADFVIPDGDRVMLFDAKLNSNPDRKALNPVEEVLGKEHVSAKILVTPDSGDVNLPKSGVKLRGVTYPMGSPATVRKSGR